MEQSYYLGLDPGASGGLALVSEGDALAFALPETEGDIRDLIEEYRGQIAFAVIEAVHSMPKQGVASSFKFGQSYGFLRGLLVGLRIPFEAVTPQTWQKAIGCLTHGEKNVSKAKAQQLFPRLKVIHATADALLLAEHGRRLAASRKAA